MAVVLVAVVGCIPDLSGFPGDAAEGFTYDNRLDQSVQVGYQVRDIDGATDDSAGVEVAPHTVVTEGVLLTRVDEIRVQVTAVQSKRVVFDHTFSRSDLRPDYTIVLEPSGSSFHPTKG